MSNTATLDAAGEAADAVSRLSDRYLRANGGNGDAQDLVTFARFIWLTVQEKWAPFQTRLDQGLEAGEARQAAASTALACDRLLRVVAQLERGRSSGAGEVDGLPELIAAVPQVRAIQKGAQELVDALDTPAPPIDEARLAAGVAAARRGECENTAAIVERLRAGGEL
jgi:hypothetical protein